MIRLYRLLHFKTRVFAFLVLTVVTLYVVGGRLALSLLPDYQEDLEKYLSEQLEIPVFVGGLKGKWIGFDPVVSLEGVALKDEANVLIGEVAIRLSFLDTILNQAPRFKSILIEDTSLDVQQISKQHFIVSGLDVDLTAEADADMVAMTDIVRWLDGAFITLQQNKVNFTSTRRVTRSWRLPSITVSYHGDQVFASGQLVRSGNTKPLLNFALEGSGALTPEPVSGTLYLEARSSSFLNEILRVYDWNDLSIEDIDLSSRTWLNFDGLSVTNIYGDIQVKELNWNASNRAMDPLKNVAAHVNLDRSDSGRVLEIDGFSFDWRDQRCSSPSISLNLGAEAGQLFVDQVDVACLSSIAAATGLLSNDLQHRLDISEPSGKLNNILARWASSDVSKNEESGDNKGSVSEESFFFEAEMDNVSLDAYFTTPMGRGIDGYVRADSSGGGVFFQSNRFELGFPTLYLNSWKTRLAEGAVFWETRGDDIDVFSDGLRLFMRDGSLVYGDFILRLNPDDEEDYLSLALAMQDVPFHKVTTLVPYYEVSDDLYQWLDDSLVEGFVTQGIYLGYGSVEEESADNSFTSSLALDTREGNLRFEPTWPPLKDLDATVLLQNSELAVDASRATIHGTELLGLSAFMAEGAEVLKTKAHVTASPEQVDYWLMESPLAENTRQIGEQIDIGGAVNVDIGLEVPLSGIGDVEYDIVANLEHQTVTHHDSELVFSDVKGQIQVDSKVGIKAKDIKASLFGELALLSIDTLFREPPNRPEETAENLYGIDDFDVAELIASAGIGKGDPFEDLSHLPRKPQPSSEIKLTLNGRADTDRLFKQYELAPFPELQGKFNFDATLSIPGEYSEQEYPLLTVSSDLKGVTRKWPAPLAKLADDQESIVYEMLITPDKMRGNITMNGDHIPSSKGHLLFTGNKLSFANINIGESTRSHNHSQGINIVGDVPSADLQEWIEFINTHFSSSEEGDESLELMSLGLDIKSLKAFGYLLPDVGASFKQIVREDKTGTDQEKADQQNEQQHSASRDQKDVWQIELTGPSVQGQVLLPLSSNDKNGASDEALDLKFKHLNLVSVNQGDKSEQNKKSTESEVHPDDLPALHFASDSITVDSKPYGAWDARIEPYENGVYFRDVKAKVKSIDLNGQLNWSETGGAQNSILTLSIDGKNIEDLMKVFDWPPTVSSDEIKGNIALVWPNSPMNFELAKLSGSVDIKMEEGFLKTSDEKTGALRLFGILNAEALVRRLKLDFSDLYKSGVGYDELTVKAVMDQGKLKLEKPLVIDGPSSAYEIRGRADLATKELDMVMKVELPIAQNVPLAALLLGAPQIGGAVWLVDKLLGEPLSEVTSARYTLTGPWDDPKLDYGK